MKNNYIIRVLAILAILTTPLFAQRIKKHSAINIVIRGIPADEISQISGNYTVDENGQINLPHLGKISASGKKPAQLASVIQGRYISAEIYTTPRVTIGSTKEEVAIIQDLITLDGKINSPGAKPWRRGMTLAQAVASGGGPSTFGSSRVKVYRGNQVQKYDLKNPSHKLLQILPSDTIEVLKKGAFEWR